MIRPRAEVLIEYIPVPQPAVATEIYLAGTNSPDRHADLPEVLSAVPAALATSGQRLYPFRTEFLVFRHQLVEVRAGEWARHGAPGLKRQHSRGGSREPEELAPGRAGGRAILRAATRRPAGRLGRSCPVAFRLAGRVQVHYKRRK